MGSAAVARSPRIVDHARHHQQVGEREQARQQRHTAADATAVMAASRPLRAEQLEFLLSLRHFGCQPRRCTSSRFQRGDGRLAANHLVSRLYMYRRRQLGRNISMRDPNFITPNRSPAATCCPTVSRQTMRRARIPTIWRTTTGPPGASNHTSVHSLSSPASLPCAGEAARMILHLCDRARDGSPVLHARPAARGTC